MFFSSLFGCDNSNQIDILEGVTPSWERQETGRMFRKIADSKPKTGNPTMVDAAGEEPNWPGHWRSCKYL